MNSRFSQAEARFPILICLAAFCNLGASSPATADSFVKFHLPHTQQVNVPSINASNVAVGFMYRDDKSLVGFMRAADGATTTITVNHQPTIATSINGSGTIVGYYNVGARHHAFHGYIRAPDGSITIFDAPGAGTLTGQGTGPTAVNDSGLVTGYYIDSANVFHGFVRNPVGTINSFDAGHDTLPRGINSDGLITGEYYAETHHGFLRAADGSITTIDPPGALDTTVAGINNNGEIVGAFNDGSEWRVFIREPQGTFHKFNVPNSTRTDDSGINDNGVVTGLYIDKKDVWHGYLRYPDGTIETFDPSKSNSTAPQCINDSDVVGGYFSVNSRIRGFLRIP